MRCSDAIRTSRIVAYLIERRAPVIKRTTLSEEKKSSGPRKFKKKWDFSGFHTLMP